jgi:hypothetical protein
MQRRVLEASYRGFSGFRGNIPMVWQAAVRLIRPCGAPSGIVLRNTLDIVYDPYLLITKGKDENNR